MGQTGLGTNEVEVIVDRQCLVGEGAIWDSRRRHLLWVDILGHLLFIYDPATGENREINLLQAVGTVVPRTAGGVVVALHNGFATLDLETERMTPIADPEADIPGNRFNDGKCDPAGRLWAGTMAFDGMREREQGSLYCLDTDGTVTWKLGRISISNGIAWSADARTMYYIDTVKNDVRAFDYDLDTGAIANERVTCRHDDEGHFDGMTLDEEGMVWIAIFGGGAVKRYNPETGEHLATIELPAQAVTSCAFGGPDLDQLYITSASYRLTAAELAEQPLAGSLFRAAPGVRGVPAFEYAG